MQSVSEMKRRKEEARRRGRGQKEEERHCKKGCRTNKQRLLPSRAEPQRQGRPTWGTRSGWEASTRRNNATTNVRRGSNHFWLRLLHNCTPHPVLGSFSICSLIHLPPQHIHRHIALSPVCHYTAHSIDTAKTRRLAHPHSNRCTRRPSERAKPSRHHLAPA